MKEFLTPNIRNISIIGSAQVGKTTLGEAMLFNAGLISRIYPAGNTHLDFETDELEKKISISSAIFNIEFNKTKLNFIDTPGYPVFVSQAITAINVCESSLIVLGAVVGVEVLTKKIWKLAKSANQSKFVFINSMDKDHADFERDLEQARNYLSKKIIPIFYPIGEGNKFSGFVDIISRKAYIGDAEKEIPAEHITRVQELRSELVEAVAENSEELLNKFMEKGSLTDAEILQGIKLGVASYDIIPLMVGSAVKNIGVKKLIEYLQILAPNPEEKERMITCLHQNGQEEFKKIHNDSPTLAQIFKIFDEPKIGEFFFFKVWQGSINSAQELQDMTTRQKERIGHLYMVNGKNREEVQVLYAGDIGAAAKLKGVNISHTLYSGKDDIRVKEFEFPEPVISQSVKTKSEKDFEKLGQVLNSFTKADPCFQSEHRPEFDELIISGMSSLHIEVMMRRVKNRFNIEVTLDNPKIPYRETIQESSKAQGKYKKQTGGHGQYGDCWIEVMAKPIGSGYNFVNAISGGVIPSKFVPAVEKGVKEAMKKGVLAGYPMVDMQVKVYDGSHHTVDSSDLAFQMAGILALKAAAEKANPILLEPIMSVKVVIPDEYVGDISTDFNQRRGKIIDLDTLDDGYKVIKALVPMAELFNYATDLKSITKGEGIYSKHFEKYEPVPMNSARKIIQERKKQQ